MSAPACGCIEHAEARRRETIFMKNAYQLQRQKSTSCQMNSAEEGNCSSVSCNLDLLKRKKMEDAVHGKFSYDGLTLAQTKRLAEFEKQIRMPRDRCSAKLPHRFNNFDYLSQY